ncbi:MAG: hypothetical protein Q4P24_03460 [Rhodobacterales bacterium]|nr:hypothetical protein [Rhodobacterales bacterium]
MKYLIVLAAVAALGACGVDGPPERPAKKDVTAQTRKGTPEPAPGKWITGFTSQHMAVTL